MSKGFNKGDVVFSLEESEVFCVLASNMLNTTAVTLDGTEVVTAPTDTFEPFKVPAATI